MLHVPFKLAQEQSEHSGMGIHGRANISFFIKPLFYQDVFSDKWFKGTTNCL